MQTLSLLTSYNVDRLPTCNIIENNNYLNWSVIRNIFRKYLIVDHTTHIQKCDHQDFASFGFIILLNSL